jgi:hypothetical protein
MGQVQYWFSFKVKEPTAKLRLPAKSEFRAYQWVSFRTAVERVVAFKRPLYRELQKRFAKVVTKHPQQRCRVISVSGNPRFSMAKCL